MPFKELGKRQVKVLLWVAKNPNSHAKAIQEGIRYPQYGNINTDVKKLKKYYLFDSIKEPSSEKRKRLVEKYFCTEKGVYLALINANSEDLLIILKVEKDKYSSLRYFYSKYEVGGEDEFIFWFRSFLEFYGNFKDVEIQDIIVNWLLNYDVGLYTFEDRLKNMLDAIEYFPSTKKKVDEMRDVLNKVSDRGKKID